MSTKRTHARTRFDAPPRHPREAAEERIVAQLAERMRAKLAQRRHHGDWRALAVNQAMDLLRAEFAELEDTLTDADRIAEAVDVAACCAILIDVLRMEGES